MAGSDFTLTLPLAVPKPVVVTFDGGDLSSDGGFAALAAADHELQVCARLAAAIQDRRDPRRVDHSMLELIRERVCLISGAGPRRKRQGAGPGPRRTGIAGRCA